MPGRSPSGERDRDAAGRARNARPRDALGRPLRRSATGTPSLASDQALPPGQALHTAQRLLDAGRPFDAHDVLEAVWKASPDPERDLWQGLAQLAVGLTHARRGNGRGAVTLLRRGAQRLGGYSDTTPYGIDVTGLRSRTAELAALIEAAGLADLDPRQLTVTLLVPEASG
jgi:uncharacterized protein